MKLKLLMFVMKLSINARKIFLLGAIFLVFGRPAIADFGGSEEEPPLTRCAQLLMEEAPVLAKASENKGGGLSYKEGVDKKIEFIRLILVS